jgi:hypothetical protein
MTILRSSPYRTVSAALAFSSALALAACSEDAQSAPSTRVEPAAAVETEQPRTEPAVTIEELPRADGSTPVVAERPAAPRSSTRPTPRPALPSAPSSAPAQAPAARPFVAAGTQLATTVEDEMSTETAKQGDRFHAVLADDVLGENGVVLIPKGAVVNGRVATSRESAGANDPAVLELEVESITTGGQTLALQADVVEVEAEIGRRDSSQKTAVKVGAGAAAGAVIGRILGGDKKDALKGAIAGAAAGTAAAIATKDGQAVVKPGARMVVRLTDRLVLQP